MTSSYPQPGGPGHHGPDPQPPRPQPAIPDVHVPSARELGKDMARELGHGLLEIAVWAVAVLVVVGGLGLVGYLAADGTGLLAGVVAGVVVLGVLWLVLMVKGVSLAASTVRRGQPPR